ncbi:hypothetical protein [Staphylococcus equorum]|uniref:Uncharacterized protein n=1 Tax=Staphylococcus equorum TaxID=246432 RepID=A0A9X4LD17_9STAP|nr:hypothetical protein [Staphylococcus equorum]MDG0860342.1 hypothetical protein [Staphylococcus equorum]
MIKVDEFEKQKAKDYFDEIPINNIEIFDSSINTLIEYLQSYGFTFNDVSEFYSWSDLQDEEDITRLKNYLDIVEGLENVTRYMEILAKKDNMYLVIDDED